MDQSQASPSLCKGLHANEDNLTRIIVSRNEIDMIQIRAEFENITGRTLLERIQVHLPLTNLIGLVNSLASILGSHQGKLPNSSPGTVTSTYRT